MKAETKLTIWYMFLVIILLGLTSVVYSVMARIDSRTTDLENRIRYRSLSDLVDKDYQAVKAPSREDEVPTLNALSNFFMEFHENTVWFKNNLEDFAKKRAMILKRFRSSSIDVADLSVMPNSQVSSYTMNYSNPEINFKRFHLYSKQYPFTKELVFNRKEQVTSLQNSYYLCSARIALSCEVDTSAHVGFIEEKEPLKEELFSPHFVFGKRTSVFNLNRIIKVKDSVRTTISVRGYAKDPLLIEKVEAYCISFNDVE